MFIKNSLSSIVLVIIFLVFTSLAIILYGGTKQQKADFEQNVVWRQARFIADWGLAYITGVNQTDLSKSSGQSEVDNSVVIQEENLNIGNNLKNLASSSGVLGGATEVININKDNLNSNEATSSLSSVLADFKSELDAAKNNPEKIDISKKGWSDFISWEKDSTGASLSIKSKGEEKYRLNFPFKFLAK